MAPLLSPTPRSGPLLLEPAARGWGVSSGSQRPVPRKKTPGEALALRSHPGQPVLITTAGNASPERLSPGPSRNTLCEQRVTSGGPQPRAGSRGPQPGTLRAGEPGPALSPRRAAPTVSQQPAGGRAGCLGASRPTGSPRAPGGPERPAPPARPPSHTVSQQHHSRLARPLSAASDRHRPRRAGGAAGTAPGPLPMEWRMSMEASRSVLSRD